jgi:hypothetical protein
LFLEFSMVPYCLAFISVIISELDTVKKLYECSSIIISTQFHLILIGPLLYDKQCVLLTLKRVEP